MSPPSQPKPAPLTDEDIASLEPEIDPETGIDLSLLRTFQRMTVEERWQAHEDALAFANDLQLAMKRHNGQA